MKNDIQNLLMQNIELLQKSLETFQLSVNKCSKIGIKNEFTFEESESFDALTSKFARTSDIYTQKVLRTIFILIKEPQLTIIDMANRAEKLDLITSADDLLEIRDIRNEISHEYIQEILYELFGTVLEKAGSLISCINKTTNYLIQHNFINRTI